jgi:hypothetical protein
MRRQPELRRWSAPYAADMGELTHERRLIAEPEGWVAYVSRKPARRLIVFVHGFGGKGVKTWRRFSESGAEGDWWRESDLLFVRYDSMHRNIVGTADHLRAVLPHYLDRLPDDLRELSGESVREGSSTYEDIYLVGHSLGGVVIRRALVDAAQAWIDERLTTPGTPRPRLLDARVRLFSPASAGFQPSGCFWLLRALGLWSAVDLRLSSSSAYLDLQPDSILLRETRRRTETLVATDHTAFGALRAQIVWANPENVVATERYDSDPVQFSAQDTTHLTVCKPNADYRLPWVFVETGTP